MIRDEIKPFAIYTAEETAHLIGTDKRTIYSKVDSGELTAKTIGKGYKILGENILAFMGSATFGGELPKPIDTSGEAPQTQRTDEAK